MGEVEVRLRLESDSTAREFTTYSIDELEKLIHTLEAWGIYDQASGDMYSSVVGNFVIPSNGKTPFFELIVVDIDL